MSVSNIPNTSPSSSSNVASATPDPNPIIAGYKIGEEMGKGPLGKIYRAANIETGEKVVFRGFARPEGADPEKWETAKNQFRDLLSKHHQIDRHPVIQDIIAFGEENGLFWIATEYFEGRTLQQIMASNGAQQMPWCLEVMKQVADAVDYAADHGLIHTDLTPYNILLVNHPESPDKVDVRVINFGLAHARPKFGSRYAAPEQQDGFEGDSRSDVYAVGALFLELLTGKSIFTGTTPEEIAQKVRTEDPMKALVGRPSYIQNVIGAMLVKAPRFRYSHVLPAIEDLVNKRSPAGADRHDNVEMNTDALLAERKLERKQADTAEDELRGAWNEAENKERFRRIEVGDEVVQTVAGAKPAKGRVVSQFADFEKIGLQEYRLSEMDVLEIKWKAEHAKQHEEAEREFNEKRWGPLIKWGIMVGLVALGIAHSSNIVNSYQSATVIATRGTATHQKIPTGAKSVKQLSKPIPLKKGEVLTKADLPMYVVTGATGSVTFSLVNGEAIYVPANSAIEVRDLGYDSGPIRTFVLWNGRVATRTQPALRGKGEFHWITVEGVKCDVAGDSRLSLSSKAAGGGRTVVVATQNGLTKVAYASTTTDVKAGNQVTIHFPGEMESEKIDATNPYYAAEDKALGEVPAPAGVLRLLYAVEENTVMPITEIAKSIWAVPTSMNDGKDLALATTSMQALCALMATSDSETGSPATLDLQTLSPLSLPEADRKKIMNSFDGGKLVAYKALPNGYEILARAKDSKHTWIRGKNGSATTAGTGKEPTK